MKTVLVGMGTCGMSAGAQAVYARLEEKLAANPGVAELKATGCIGMCYREPLVEIREKDRRTIYGGVTPELAGEIVEHASTRYVFT